MKRLGTIWGVALLWSCMLAARLPVGLPPTAWAGQPPRDERASGSAADHLRKAVSAKNPQPEEPAGDWNGLPHASMEPALMKARWAAEHGWGDWSPRENWDPDTTGYDALHVDLLLEPLIEEEAVIGRVSWTVTLTEALLTSLAFNFYDNMEISETRINGLPASFTHENDVLRLHLPFCPAIGDTLRAKIAYSGVPQMGFLWGFDIRYHEGVPVIYTNDEPIASRTWWPCKDRPDDKFTADLSFIVPDTLMAASNGTLVEVESLPGARTLYHWRERYPITTYLVSLVATNFATFEDTYVGLDGTEMPLTYYAYPEHLDRAMEYWEFTPLAVTFLAETFGEYPFIEEKYGMAEYPWSGAMEHQTLTSMGAYFLTMDEPSDWVVVHELAHQWWGNWVTCGTWRDIWLNEGFAVYCEALWAEHLGGPDSLRSIMLTKKSDHFPGSCYDPDFIFNSTVYRKGAWVMHMLRHVVGDRIFFEALREYGQRHAYGNAVTEDLHAIFEETWGQPLDWFFDEWVYGEGQPRYGVCWNPVALSADGTTIVQIEITQQTTGPDYFKMPLDARFLLEGGREYWTVLWDSLPEQHFLVQLPAPPDSLLIDPMDWVLGNVLYVCGPMSVEEPDADAAAIVPGIALGAPRPNPTRSITVIPIGLTRGAASGQVDLDSWLRLEIVDASGRLVRRLGMTATSPATAPSSGGGYFLWDGRDDRGHPVSAGIYHASMHRRDLPAGETARSQVKRILLLR